MREDKFIPIIGLEVHIELGTRSKMFCGCPARHFATSPNSQTCPVCLGLPGALPVPNQTAIAWTQLLGAALGCKLAEKSWFDRKHYFYPDLPKGYQISQYAKPFAEGGLWVVGGGKKVRIRRVHLEEDTAKLLHEGGQTLIDFNRSGVPLVEIVTEPDLHSAAEARELLQSIQQLVRWLGISDADMEKGSMRLEANVSLATKAQVTSKKLPDYRVELKNINSFRFVEQAINYEIRRQSAVIKKGGRLIQETRGFVEKTGETRGERWKEEARDYRYFPEPDIPSLTFSTKELAAIKKQLPELPDRKRQRFEKEFKLPKQYVGVLTENRGIADYFEETARLGKKYGVSAKKIADTLVNKKVNIEKVLPAKLIEILRVEKPVLSNEELEKAVLQSIKVNPKAVADYKKGKGSALQFLIGQTMAKTGGQADPQKVAELLKKRLL